MLEIKNKMTQKKKDRQLKRVNMIKKNPKQYKNKK